MEKGIGICGENVLTADVRHLGDVKLGWRRHFNAAARGGLHGAGNTDPILSSSTKGRETRKSRKGRLLFRDCQDRHSSRVASFKMTPPPIKHKALLNVDLGEAVSRNSSRGTPE